MRAILMLAFLAAGLSGAAPLGAQSKSGSSTVSKPAATVQMALPSHGEMLLGVFYLAAGAGPHPTAIIFHGFPGFEQNLDIAQYLRAHGWNVLAMHYRGSWGVKGNFSFEHCAEDADTQVRFLLDPANAQKYRIDTRRVIVIGHSMGGFMAASATAHNKQVAAAVLISAWNIGAEYKSRILLGSATPTIDNVAKFLALDNNLLPLSGTSGEALAREIYEHQSALNINNLAPAIAPRPVFVITASEGLAPSDHAFAEALRKAGDAHVAERHWDTDHSYSGVRAELSRAILEWAQEISAH
ncbi:MAG TPA: alpha/beta fold hydrolase [Candidatus Acidoferrales bacterium]|nr:alpha/beta fold hydrolase [Candidatus Acidoferrales bacterium]